MPITQNQALARIGMYVLEEDVFRQRISELETMVNALRAQAEDADAEPELIDPELAAPNGAGEPTFPPNP